MNEASVHGGVGTGEPQNVLEGLPGLFCGHRGIHREGDCALDRRVNQITEIQLLGNNSKVTKHITLNELPVTSHSNRYVKKLVFGKNSFIKTNRIKENESMPIAWGFTGSNTAINQDNNLYGSSIDSSLGEIILNNKKNKNTVQVTLSNPKNKNIFSSVLYVNEIYNIPSITVPKLQAEEFIDEEEAQEDANPDNPVEQQPEDDQGGEQPGDQPSPKVPEVPEQDVLEEKIYTSLAIPENFTVRLVNKDNMLYNNDFISRDVIISHSDKVSCITDWNPTLDPIVQYKPISKFLQTTFTLEDQLQKYKYDIDEKTKKKRYNAEFYTSLPKTEFSDLEFAPGDNNNTVNLDLTVAFDRETYRNKIQFYNMIEYVYNEKYNDTEYEKFASTNEEKINKHNKHFSESNPHLFIPLYRYQSNKTQYYFVTGFEIFPGYTKDKLVQNFLNATDDKIKLNNIIPNIYIGANPIQFKDNDKINFGTDNPSYTHEKYAVYTKDTISD
ncbi:MAG: hypothetical protein IJU54_02755 [Alphaproteobacteria bacterium]|nr:hypothetical protein [Alphaproteobacteria bacterium]